MYSCSMPLCIFLYTFTCVHYSYMHVHMCVLHTHVPLCIDLLLTRTGTTRKI
jgi:hypothetical protein